MSSSEEPDVKKLLLKYETKRRKKVISKEKTDCMI